MFLDRREAGSELAKLLAPAYKDKDALVLAIPRGGVLVGYEVARELRAELSVVITKKLPHPLQEELAVGAVAEDGSLFLTSYARSLDRETIRHIIDTQKEEIASRIRRFRKGKPLPDMAGRIAIVVDDGIATGSTIVPAIKLCRARRAAKVIVAAPVSGVKYAGEIDELADEVIVAAQPDDFYAVGQVYEDFHHLSDQEVTDLLAASEGEVNGEQIHQRRK